MTDAEKLRELVYYCPETGAMTWKKSSPRAKAGDGVGWLNSSNHLQTSFQGKKHLVHRLAWLYMTGEWPTHQIDHIDGNRTNNSFGNLRRATHAQNLHNARRSRNNTSGYKGVVFDKNAGKWAARICCNGTRTHLGLFSTAEQAHRAYCVAAEKLHGEFARIA